MVKKIVSYIQKKYKVKPERPWAKYPENMTFKAKTNRKWFALILPVNAKTLGLKNDETVYLLNVKADSDFIGMISASEGYLPGYHMNKQHWLSVKLDGSVDEKTIFSLIDESYALVTDSPTIRIYEAVKKIPRGRVATYGQVAALAGNPRMSRAVGNALHKNPDPKHIPCYRVVNAKGELAGAFAFGGGDVQAELLRADGIEVTDGRVDLSRYGMTDELKPAEHYYTYIVKCSDDSLYTGWTTNLDKRMKTHNSKKGAKYTRSRTPVTLVYYEESASKELAMKREYAIKQLTRNEKEELIKKHCRMD